MSQPRGEINHGKERRLFTKFHREGFTWKDSIIISFLVFFLLFVLGSIIAIPIGDGIRLLENEENADFLEVLCDNFGFLGYWIITLIYLLIFKSDKPILRAIGREPKGNTVKMLLWGFLIGLVLNTLCAGAAILHGDIRISFSSFPVIKILLVFVSVFVQSSGEELLCRGVLYQRLRKGYKNPWVAILVNPLIFVLLHMWISGCTIWAIISIYLVGMMFGLMVYYFDSLWMAMAAHAAWNFTQNFIFGLPNSGTVYDFSIFRLDQEAAKDSLFYNVMFGVEASLTAVIIFAVPCAVILYMMKKKPRTSLDVWNKQEG